MELPVRLREAVDRALEGIPLAALSDAAARLSDRYRSETHDGRPHISDDMAARAYLATRLPATYAAARASFAAVAELRPDFAPQTMIDLGAGPGTALFAAEDCWPSLAEATLVEASPAARAIGEALARVVSPVRVAWRGAHALAAGRELAPAELVTLAYVLGEIPEQQRRETIDQIWAHTRDMVVVVEPGTPAGWRRILDVRQQLIDAGAHLIAPCPHGKACPLSPPDWCHFSQRLPRSRVHRRAKGAEVPWEDEKYIYIAASRVPGRAPAARIVGPPRPAKGRVTLKFCREDGEAEMRLFSRRDGAAFKAARRADWGDAWWGVERDEH